MQSSTDTILERRGCYSSCSTPRGGDGGCSARQPCFLAAWSLHLFFARRRFLTMTIFHFTTRNSFVQKIHKDKAPLNPPSWHHPMHGSGIIITIAGGCRGRSCCARVQDLPQRKCSPYGVVKFVVIRCSNTQCYDLNIPMPIILTSVVSRVFSNGPRPSVLLVDEDNFSLKLGVSRMELEHEIGIVNHRCVLRHGITGQ